MTIFQTFCNLLLLWANGSNQKSKTFIKIDYCGRAKREHSLISFFCSITKTSVGLQIVLLGTGCPNKFGVGQRQFSEVCWDTLYQVVRGNRRENVKCLKTDLLAWHTNSLIQFDIRTRNGSNLRKPPKREDQGMNENEYSLL